MQGVAAGHRLRARRIRAHGGEDGVALRRGRGGKVHQAARRAGQHAGVQVVERDQQVEHRPHPLQRRAQHAAEWKRAVVLARAALNGRQGDQPAHGVPGDERRVRPAVAMDEPAAQRLGVVDPLAHGPALRAVPRLREREPARGEGLAELRVARRQRLERRADDLVAVRVHYQPAVPPGRDLDAVRRAGDGAGVDDGLGEAGGGGGGRGGCARGAERCQRGEQAAETHGRRMRAAADARGA
jgi:hypothetical protein